MLKRAVPDGTSNPQYVTFAGDVFGAANEVGTFLKADQRYRLICSVK